MSSINEHDILEALHHVPQEQWPAVLEWLQAMRQPSERPGAGTAQDLLNSGVIGLWGDRSDIADSRGFADQLRRQAQQRESGHAPGH